MIEYLEHHIVDHCNLNCAGCSHFSPLAPTWFETIDQFEEDFGELALKTKGKVGMIRLMGGEPLLHPNLIKFLESARDLFPTTEIQVVTNGLLLSKLKKQLQPVCMNLKILICMSDYGLKNLDLLDGLRNFPYARIDDQRKFYNIGLDISGAQNPLESFMNCDLHLNKWYFFQDGWFYPCCISANLSHFINHFNLPQMPEPKQLNAISIHTHSIEEIEEFLARPISTCKYCTVGRKKNIEFHQSKKEISEWTCQ